MREVREARSGEEGEEKGCGQAAGNECAVVARPSLNGRECVWRA